MSVANILVCPAQAGMFREAESRESGPAPRFSFETLYGIKKRTTNRIVWAFDGLQKTLAYYSQSQVLPFDDAAAAKYEELRRQHRRFGRDDLRIAAIALARNTVLVTQNVGDFAAIEGLRTENWLA